MRAYDPDPPAPSFKRTGMMFELNSYRTNFLYPHLAEQNRVLESALIKWWARIETVAGLLTAIDELVMMVADCDSGGFEIEEA